MAYQQNLAMKINAKLGGTNQAIAGGLLPQVYNTPTMIMGADVHHPGAGSFSPSIGGVVASFNRDFTQYNTYVREQENRKEGNQRIEKTFAKTYKCNNSDRGYEDHYQECPP